jgi:hypothetical protein
MDYATHAFVNFAALGCPTRQQHEERIRQGCYQRYAMHEPSYIVNKANAEVLSKEPLLKDIDAVNRVLDILHRQNKDHIIAALQAVYFAYPKGKPERGVIVSRVTRYAIDCPASTKAVYEWLKSARLLFAQIRELDTNGESGKW